MKSVDIPSYEKIAFIAYNIGVYDSIVQIRCTFRRWLIQKKIDAFEELKKEDKFQMTVSKNQERYINVKSSLYVFQIAMYKL